MVKVEDNGEGGKGGEGGKEVRGDGEDQQQETEMVRIENVSSKQI